jgi:hypothetical protein
MLSFSWRRTTAFVGRRVVLSGFPVPAAPHPGWAELRTRFGLGAYPHQRRYKRRRPTRRVPALKRLVDSMVYASVLLGLLLLYAASALVPTWLLASLAAGEVAYGLAAVGVARGYRKAYYAVIVLALLVLAASLPQPEHYAFATEGDIAQFLIFLAGSVLQAALLISIPVHLIASRRSSVPPPAQAGQAPARP